MTHHDAAHDDTEDRFYAQFDSREVELMTLDELQAAFETGRIHGNTFVCREGESEWLTLAEVAGLGEEEAAQPAVAPVAQTRPPMPARGPDLAGVGETRSPLPNRRPDMPAADATRPPLSNQRPNLSAAGVTPPPLPTQRTDMQAAAETRPPMLERRPRLAAEPTARTQMAQPSASSMVQSYAPVTSNIASARLDLDELALRPKRRWGLIFAGAAALGAAGGAAAFVLSGGAGALASALPSTPALQAAANHSQASLSLSNIQTKRSEPKALPLLAPPAPQPAAGVAAPSEAPKPASVLGKDMKQALLAADKARLSKHASKLKARAPFAAPRRSKASTAPGLKSGGSAYDPSNGKL